MVDLWLRLPGRCRSCVGERMRPLPRLSRLRAESGSGLLDCLTSSCTCAKLMTEVTVCSRKASKACVRPGSISCAGPCMQHAEGHTRMWICADD